MYFQEFIDLMPHFQNTLSGGFKAQLEMAPADRRFIPPDSVEKAVEASVLILFFPDKHGKTVFLLSLRSRYDGKHSGQVAFPGGKVEHNETLLDAALRETREETGIIVPQKNLIKKLTPLFIPVSGYIVHPFWMFYEKFPEIKLNYEISEVFFPGIEDLLNHNKRKTRKYSDRDIPYYAFGKYFVWGATAMMLSELESLIRRVIE